VELILPIPRDEDVLTSSRRSRAREKSLSVGADSPVPNRLSRKVAPSGLEPVVPGILVTMTEFAGTVK
jgi:hypothetical protein